MKRLFLSRVTAALCLLSSLGTASLLHAADSPTTISGQTFDTVITSASGTYRAPGTYRWVLTEDGKYSAYSFAPALGDESGNFVYQRVTASAGQMSFNTTNLTGFVLTLTYNGTNTGSFVLGNVAFPGNQRGTFRSYHGTAPANADKKVFVIQNATGDLQFAGRSSFRMITRSNEYTIQDVTGAPNLFTTGKQTYSKGGKSSGIMQFTDATHTNKMAIFTFETATSGSVFMRHNTNRMSLAGTFTMASLKAPSVVTQPVSTTAAVGGRAVLSATISGTKPISYRWYKGTEPMQNETRTNLVFQPVVKGDEGVYSLRAENFAGQVQTTLATLTTVCQYSVSTNRVFATYQGGNHQVQVRPGGGCGWIATNSVPWITLLSGLTNSEAPNLNFSVDPNTSSVGRIGHFQVKGGDSIITVTVVQGTAFVPEDVSVAGRTMAIEASSAEGLYPGTKTNLVVFSSGNSTAAVVARKGEVNTEVVDYTFMRTADDSATFTLANAELGLTYTSATAGTFVGTNAAGSEVRGDFRWVSSAPDFNDDFKGDIVWQAGNRSLAAWYMNGAQFLSAATLANGGQPPLGSRAFGAADFNRDGNTDVILQDSASKLKVWLMDGNQRIGTVTLREGKGPVGWKAFSTGDFNNDGHADVVFQHTDGRLLSWLFEGTNFLSAMQLRGNQSAGTAWKAISAADFNGDGQTDIVVQHTNGKIAIWYLNNGATAATEMVRGGVTPAGWRLVGAGDINGDAEIDLILLTPTNQAAVLLKKNGGYSGTPVYLRNKIPVTTGWTFVAPK